MKKHSIDPKDEEPIKKKKQSMTLSELLQRYLVILVFNGIFILIFAYFISPLSKINTILVEGNENVYIQEIIDESGLKTGDSVYKSRRKFDEIENKIVDELPQVSKAELGIDGLNDIFIEVDEFKTVAYIAKDEAYLRVLENGRVLDDHYTVSIGNQLVLSKFEEGEALNKMIEELKNVDQSILNLISEIEWVKTEKNPLFIEVYMNNGNRILSKIPEFSEKLSYYPQMVQAVEGRKGIFDMEAGIYFTPFADGEDEKSGLDEDAGQEIDELES